VDIPGAPHCRTRGMKKRFAPCRGWSFHAVGIAVEPGIAIARDHYPAFDRLPDLDIHPVGRNGIGRNKR
jgi:hypothetical protein